MMRIGVLGAAGQLGSELCSLLGEAAVCWSRPAVDITSRESIRLALDMNRVDAVINAAAYNKVDLAEDEPETAFQQNGNGPRMLAQECASRQIVLMHVSTDYVYGLNESRDVPYVETDSPGPLSVYGVSKLCGEHFVRAACRESFVIRTCGLFGHAARRGAGKGNFVETMIRLGRDREELRVVNDQHCTPTSVADLSRALIELIKTREFGLYHATNAGATTWAELASEIFRYEQMSTKVKPIPAAEYLTKARRPSYSVLNCAKLERVVGKGLPDWRSALHQYLDERRLKH